MESNNAVSREITDIPEDLECSICGDLFDKAVSLKACDHTYCSICIRNHWVTTSRPGVHRQSKKECPMCRAAVGNDVSNALVINREIQEAVKSFKHTVLRQSPSSERESYKNESPIKKRIQPRNYAGMQKKGKKELQKVCKELNLLSSGSDQELVDRLRSFECMWNAELDTIDTPLKPSELVAKFKKKERMQREEKSRDIMTGKANDLKHMKKLTSYLLDNENLRNDKTVGKISSGNVTFDAKFKSNFSALVAQGRRQMKKESYWSSPRKSGGIRTYDDDDIHDGPKQNTNGNLSCGDKSSMDTRAAAHVAHSLERAPCNDLPKVDQLSQKKKKNVCNPYISDHKRKFRDPSINNMAKNKQCMLGNHTSNTSARLRPSPSKAPRIHNPYKKKQSLQQHTPSPCSVASYHATSPHFDSGPLTPIVNPERNLQKSQSSQKNHGGCTPLAQADNMYTTTNIHRKKFDEKKVPGIRSIEISNTSDNAEVISTTLTQKKKIIRNPYISSRYRNR